MTQNSTKVTKNNFPNIDFKRLSIQLNLDGLSFCIFNPALGCIESIHHMPVKPSMPVLMVEQLLSDFLTQPVLRQDFDTIKVIHNNEQFAFVPTDFFHTEAMASYLKFNVKNYQNQIISYEAIPQAQTVNVYLPYASINKILRENYGIFEYEHFASSLLRVLLSHNPKQKDAIYCHFEQNAFHLVVFQQGKMVFFNRFSFEAEMDMLYYLLFSLEQLEIDTEVFPIYLLGDIIRNSEKYKLIYRYIRYIYFLPPQKSSPFCQNMDATLARRNFILTHSF